MDEKELLAAVEVNQWVQWENKAQVFYWNYSFTKRNELNRIFEEIKPDVVFINGLYSFYFNLLPLYYSYKSKISNIVLSVRGMLHPGALSQKSTKKNIYLKILKISGLFKKVNWHATDKNEEGIIKKIMGVESKISIAGNFPNMFHPLLIRQKEPGQLVLGTIALISPMKNHKAIAEALLTNTNIITWYIYGGVKDEQYWKECNTVMQQLPKNIQVVYKGMLEPVNLEKALEQIQVFIMPSESENFGHAIVEALSAGKPVITTNTTPFIELTTKKAGFIVAANELSTQLATAIQKFVFMDQTEYNQYCKNATEFINDFISIDELHTQYKTLFNWQR